MKSVELRSDADADAIIDDAAKLASEMEFAAKREFVAEMSFAIAHNPQLEREMAVRYLAALLSLYKDAITVHSQNNN